MFEKKLNDLQARKELIVLESDLNRNLVGLELANLRQRLHETRSGFKVSRPWLMTGGAVAGWVAIRNWRKLSRWLPMALMAWRWVRPSKRVN